MVAVTADDRGRDALEEVGMVTVMMFPALVRLRSEMYGAGEEGSA